MSWLRNTLRLNRALAALAESVVMTEVLPQLVYSLTEQNVSVHRGFSIC